MCFSIDLPAYKVAPFLVIVQVGLLRIEEFHQARGEKLPVSLVVSLGSGTYPPKQLGSINAQQYLYFGTHWLNVIKQQSLHEIRNLAELLSNAVSYACSLRCKFLYIIMRKDGAGEAMFHAVVVLHLTTMYTILIRCKIRAEKNHTIYHKTFKK